MTDLKITPGEYVVNKFESPPVVNIKHVVELTIQNYFGENKQMTHSPGFYLYDTENILKARIVIHNSNKRLLFGVHVILSEDKEKIGGELKIFLRLKDGINRSLTEGLMTRTSDWTLGWRAKHRLHHTRAKCYINNANLHVILKIYVNLTTNNKPLDTQNQLLKDLGSLLSSEELSDITFKVGDKELKAHKLMLSARSPVFNRMFKTNMAETQLGTVEITDIDFEVLQSVLVYMYTDRVDKMDTHAEKLLAAAEKYQLDDLKAKCGVFLSKSLTVENVVQRFILADLYRENKLKGDTILFIKRKALEVFKTEEWKAARNRPDLKALEKSIELRSLFRGLH